MIRSTFTWLEPRARFFLSSWQFWLGAAYFGLALTFVLTVAAFQKVGKTEAALVAAREAQAAARVSTCYQEFIEAPAARRFLAAQLVIAANQRNSLEQNISLFPNDPRAVGPMGWYVSLVKIEATIQDLQAFLQQYRTTTPTRAKCDRLADSLRIPRQNVRRQ